MEIQAKDLKRLEDIKAQPGKEIGLASKQSKLIKDPDKATRRWLAAVSVFGSDHIVAKIFNDRMWELRGGVVINPVNTGKVVIVEPKIIEPEMEKIPNRIDRSQEDFPIGCNVKIGDRRGRVSEHPFLDKEKIRVEFEDGEEQVSIYEIKRC